MYVHKYTLNVFTRARQKEERTVEPWRNRVEDKQRKNMMIRMHDSVHIAT